MKVSTLMLIAALSIGIFHPLALHAQGSLTPPGAPGPTMVTLSQVQPRTPISSVPITISVPGSYYLTTNVNVSSGNAITIATNGVTLDLSGFTISSTMAGAAGYAILINTGLRNISIADGIIQGSVTNNGSGVYSGNGFAYGIDYSGNAPVDVHVSHVSVSGCLDQGIFLGVEDSTVVESCTVRTLGSVGILAGSIKQSSAVDCGGTAINGDVISDCFGQSSGGYGCNAGETAENCVGISDGSGDGLSASAGTALNCHGFSSSGIGLQAGNAQNCYGTSNGTGTSYGVVATIAESCYGVSNGSGDGVYAYNAQNCYGADTGTGNGVYAVEIANGCYGYSASGIAVNAFIASVCHGVGVTPLSTSHNVNSF